MTTPDTPIRVVPHAPTAPDGWATVPSGVLALAEMQTAGRVYIRA